MKTNLGVSMGEMSGDAIGEVFPVVAAVAVCIVLFRVVVLLLLLRSLVGVELFDVVEVAVGLLALPVVFLVQLRSVVVLADKRMVHLLKQRVIPVTLFARVIHKSHLRQISQIATQVHILVSRDF